MGIYLHIFVVIYIYIHILQKYTPIIVMFPLMGISWKFPLINYTHKHCYGNMSFPRKIGIFPLIILVFPISIFPSIPYLGNITMINIHRYISHQYPRYVPHINSYIPMYKYTYIYTYIYIYIYIYIYLS